MALSGLDIYKLLPRTNCKECGYATCLAFAMALAQKKASLDKCPHVSQAAREALESASQPPIRLVTVGAGETRLEIGNETVMFRHEQKFYHPAGIGFSIEDTLDEAGLSGRISKINGLKFERVGQTIGPDLVCVKNSSKDKEKYLKTVQAVFAGVSLNIALYSSDALAAAEAVKYCKARRPLLICPDNAKLDEFVKMAKENNLPLGVMANTIEEAAQLTGQVKRTGVEEIVLCINGEKLWQSIQNATLIRRTALKKNFRALGYPVMAFTASADENLELAEAISYVTKYVSIVIVKTIEKDFVLPLLVLRQDIYTDPQKPVQVKPGIYEIGKVTGQSPVIVTTNFSITYFTVAGEVESSKVPTYILCCDAEGMSVLTAWAAEKFTAERIADAMKLSGIENIVGHKKVVIPGYVSVLSGKLEELSGWAVEVGPREASGLSAFLKAWRVILK